MIAKDFDLDRLKRRLTRQYFTSSEAYQIYLTQLSFLAPEDPNFLVSPEVVQIVGLSMSSAEYERNKDLKIGVFTIDDVNMFNDDARDDLDIIPRLERFSTSSLSL